MTTVANIKWYINWSEWGVYDNTPSLLTYEEIVAMATIEEAVAELNTHIEEYYNKFNNEWHIFYNLYLSSDWTYSWVYKRWDFYIQSIPPGWSSLTWYANNEPLPAWAPDRPPIGW